MVKLGWKMWVRGRRVSVDVGVGGWEMGCRSRVVVQHKGYVMMWWRCGRGAGWNVVGII